MPMDLLCRLQGENKRLKEERDALAQAIGDAMVKMGVAQAVPMTGPELIHMLESAAGAGPIPCTYPDCLSARAVQAAGEELESAYHRGVKQGLLLAEAAVEEIPTTVSVHATAHDASVATRCKEAIVMAIGAVQVPLAARTLAKHQPCGCVICTCEENEENRCMGCGAKNCGTHTVGQFPSPLYEAQ